MTEKFYYYVLSRPGGPPFYVGKGKGDRYLADRDHNAYCRAVIDKYGAENIVRSVAYVASEEEAFRLERLLISIFKNLCGHSLSNLTNGGEGSEGFRFSAEQKKHFSELRKGKPSGREGKHCSEEHKRKIKLANTGRKQSDEARKHLSEAMRGRKAWNKGLPCTDQMLKHLRNLAQASRGKKKSVESIQKMIATRAKNNKPRPRGYKMSEEICRRRSIRTKESWDSGALSKQKELRRQASLARRVSAQTHTSEELQRSASIDRR